MYGPFFFMERTGTGYAYLNMTENFCYHELVKAIPKAIKTFQEESASPQFHTDMRCFSVSSFVGWSRLLFGYNLTTILLGRFIKDMSFSSLPTDTSDGLKKGQRCHYLCQT
jgi:hypothetical protein